MKVFITGATGFLGINLVHLLVEQGAQITAIKRKNSCLDAFEGMAVTWHDADLLDLDSLLAACPDDVDVIFHLAADTNMWAARNAQQTRVNVEGTKNMIAVGLTKKPRRFVHTSSIAAYGVHDGVICESTEQKGEHCFVNYFSSKHQAEKLVKAAVAEQGLDAVILNPCHVVGPWDYHNWSQMISLVATNRLPGIPKGYGSFCHIKEVAKAHISAATKGKRGENYILGGIDATFVEFVSTISKVVGQRNNSKTVPYWVLKLIGTVSVLIAKFTGKEPDITPEKAFLISSVMKIDCQKSQKELDYQVDIDLEVMLTDCYQWMRQKEMIAPAG